MKTNFNRAIGWALLIAGLVWAARIDGWSLGQPSLSSSAVAARIFARQALVVVFISGLLQFSVARVLSTRSGRFTAMAGGLTAAGAVAYAAGAFLAAFIPASVALLPVGALFGLAGFALLWMDLRSAVAPGTLHRALRIILPVICFGFALDAVMTAAALWPDSALAAFLGPADGLRLRMLRLGRVASAALPMLAFLFELAEPAATSPRAHRIGQWGHLSGAVGMPLLLFLSAAVSFDFKYLLTLPVGAVVVGTWIAAWLAWRGGHWFAAASWLVTALSMAVGQWMGAFAFDGPFASPAFLGGYSDFARQLVRAAHTNGIVFGMIGICAAAEVEAAPHPRRRLGLLLFALGALTALAAEALRASGTVPAGSLAFGPALAAGGLGFVVLPLTGSAGNSKQVSHL